MYSPAALSAGVGEHIKRPCDRIGARQAVRTETSMPFTFKL